MLKTLTVVYPLIVSRLCDKIMKLFHMIEQWVCTVNRLRFKVWLITGLDKLSGKHYTVVFSGHPTSKNYFSELIFGNRYRVTFLGNLWVWQLMILLFQNRRRYLFMLFETRESFAKFMPGKNLFFIPDWVGAEVDLSRDMASKSKSSSSIKRNVEKINKNKYEYSISKNSKDLKYFYNNMYTPYIKVRHQNKAFLKKYTEIKKIFHDGELLFIKKDHSIIAGVIINYDQPNGTPRLTQLGVLDGNFKYVKDGVISALYYYAMEYLRDMGFRSLNVGWSRPFLHDGILNYKKKWRCRFGLETMRMFVLLPLVMNQFAKSFLYNNPFMSIHQRLLMGNVFIDGSVQGEKINLEKLKNRYLKNGLSDIMMYDLSGDTFKKIT